MILHASSLFKQHIPPVVSFHLGSMGFLTNHNFKEFKQELRQVSRNTSCSAAQGKPTNKDPCAHAPSA